MMALGSACSSVARSWRTAAAPTRANLGYRASVRLVFSDEGGEQLRNRLSAACMGQLVPQSVRW